MRRRAWRHMRRHMLGATIWLGCSAGVALAACDPGETIVRFSHVTNAETHSKGRAAAALAARVNDEMQGDLCLRVFPQAELFEDTAVIAALLRGDVELAAPSVSQLARLAPEYKLFDLPFLFQDSAALQAFQASRSGRSLLDALKGEGLQGLAYWHQGMKQMSANVPLRTPTDARGLRFRVQRSDAMAAKLGALGSVPARLALPEVYRALEAGQIDGQENTWPQILQGRFFEVQAGVTETNHSPVEYVVVASLAWLDGLAPEVRQRFEAILAEVSQAMNRETVKRNQAARESIAAAGGVVHALSPEDRAAWVAAMAPVWARFADDVGASKIDAARSFARP